MQSLSGMQLGARHRPGKDSSLSVFLLILLFLPTSFASFFVLLCLFRSAARSITYTDFLPCTISYNPRPHTNTTLRITTVGNIRLES